MNNVKKNNKSKKNSSRIMNKEKELLNDKEYKKAENLYKIKNYKEAYEKYLSLSLKYKNNKKVYKRLIECYTEDYSYKEKDKIFKKTLDEYIAIYKILANKKDIKLIDSRLEEYKLVKCINKNSRFLLIAFFGIFGVHKFLDKKYFLGFLYLFSFGVFGIGIIVDLFNDYYEFNDKFQLDIFRYFISLLILIFAYFVKGFEHYYFFIVIAILNLPIVYSYLLRFVPNFIKIIAMVLLAIFGFFRNPVINTIPSNYIGKWTTNNESTNIKEIDVSEEKTIIKFTDKPDQTGRNEYDKENKIFKVVVSDKIYYKFSLEIEENKLCVYNESKQCMIDFTIRKD